MTAPLYNNHQMPEAKQVTDSDGNKGLWFDRFYDQYDDHNWEVLKPKHNDENKGNSYWLTKHFHGKKVGNADQLKQFSLQQSNLAKSLGGESKAFKGNGHFVTGMGNPHPVENGLAWHPTLGVPYLTGAAVKGIVRNYIENYLDDTEENKKTLLLNWFGSTDKDPKKDGYETQAGNLIFFDAIPLEPVSLVVDIMTPHMGDWYQNGAKKPGDPKAVPADWHDPTPITFLAANNISLQFSYAMRQYPTITNSEYKPEAIDLEDITKVLTSALKYLGAGGKTATGYGQFSLDKKAEEDQQAQIKQQQKEAKKIAELEKAKSTMSKVAGEFFEESQKHNWETNKDAFLQQGIIESWVEKLEESPDKELQEQIEKLMEIHFKGVLADPEKTKGKKQKPVFKPRIQEIAKRLNALRS